MKIMTLRVFRYLKADWEEMRANDRLWWADIKAVLIWIRRSLAPRPKPIAPCRCDACGWRGDIKAVKPFGQYMATVYDLVAPIEDPVGKCPKCAAPAFEVYPPWSPESAAIPESVVTFPCANDQLPRQEDSDGRYDADRFGMGAEKRG